MASHVENALLREAPTTAHLARRLRQIVTELPNEQVTKELLAAVESEALPPDVYAIYLSVSDSPAAVAAGLRQPFSRFTRYAAIKAFGRNLRKSTWESVWNELGGTEGLLQLLNEVSVYEVDLLCKVIGWAGQKPAETDTLKQQRVTELLKGLLPNHFPECHHQSQDYRPLHKYYARLLPACTSEFIKELLVDDGDPFEWDLWPCRRVAESHWPMLQELAMTSLKKRHQILPDVANFCSTDVANEDFLDHFLPYLLHQIPQNPGHTKGFSASMSFSLEIVRLVSHGKERYFDDNNFETMLVWPLIRRAISRKASVDTLLEIFSLALSYVAKHHGRPVASAGWQRDSLLAYVAKCWSTQSRTFEKQLVIALRYYSLGQPETFVEIDSMLKVVSQKDRYDLLSLIMHYATAWKADINSESDLRKLAIKQWPLSFFQSLPPENAYELLLRLTRLKPDGDFLGPSRASSILAQPPLPNQGHSDPLLLSILLGHGKRRSEQDAQKSVEHHQKESSKSRDQTIRAFHAKSATFYAIASGSLDRYDKVMSWSKRYVRDPLTVKMIYSSKAINTKEGIALLSGAPQDLSQYDADKVSEAVVMGNKIILSIFETAILSLSEPSFSPGDWDGPKSLFRDVVATRIMQSRRLKNALSLTEDTIYNVLWEPTLEMLLKVEHIGLQPGHERLGFNTPNGLLSTTTGEQSLPSHADFGTACYRFLDKLARSRNDLWSQFRPTLLSDCASLANEWPRGLPIQALVGDFEYVICQYEAKSHTPYISSRALAAVALVRNPVVSEENLSEETRAAIGGFVDRYQTALRIQILQQKPGKAQEDQACAIAKHLLRLCCNGDAESEGSGLLSECEAVQLCKRALQSALQGFKIATIEEFETRYNTGYPTLPVKTSGRDPQERLEWNPMDGKSQRATTRQVSATLLDCMLEAPLVVPLKPLIIPNTYALTPGHDNLWATRKLLNLKHEGRAITEGTVVSALLFLDSRIATTSKILTLPFPSAQDTRCPPLFLEQDFLEVNKYNGSTARQAISDLKVKVPPTLLHTLSTSALDVLSNPDLNPTESSSRDQTAYVLLRLLSQGDRPELATTGILAALIDHPEASSWHRQLLRKSFVRCLAKSQTQNVMETLVTSIYAKIDKQQRLRESIEVEADDQTKAAFNAPSKPIIKITTIKFLAQFLDDAEVLSTEASVQILSDLLLKSSHVDVRVAVIESMLSKLQKCKYDATEELEEQIIQAFERCVPIMSSLNGSHVLQEVDWKLAEQTGNLPEVLSDGVLSERAPLFIKLCLTPSSTSLSSRQDDKILHRVILPALSQSRANNQRWVAIFAKKYGLGPRASSLPASSVHPQIPIQLIQSSLLRIPPWVLDLHHYHALINLKPLVWLKDFNKRLRSDPELRDLNEVQHWLRLYDRGTSLSATPPRRLASFLRNENELSNVAGKPDSIQPSQAQKCLIEQTTAVLWVRDPGFTHWKMLINLFAPPLQSSARVEDKAAWLAYSEPVLERLIAVVDDMRGSKDWQRSSRDGNPETPFLPSTFPLRLLLLDYPQLHELSPNVRNAADLAKHLIKLLRPKDKSLTIFAGQLIKMLREVQGLGLAHRDKLGDIAAAAAQVSHEDMIPLACSIGELADRKDEQNEEIIELRVELADTLLANKVRQRLMVEDQKKEVKGLVKSWMRSEIEEVRMRGVRAVRRMGLDLEE